MIKATLLADTYLLSGVKKSRATTFVVEFPRFILSQFNTHRAFSRNSSSSRAIPFYKNLKRMFGEEASLFVPQMIQKSHKGMQGTEYFTDPEEIAEIQTIWMKAAKAAKGFAEKLHKKGVTKQLCNRILEPYMMQKVIVTFTEGHNFFNLRCPVFEIDDKVFYTKKSVIRYLQSNEMEDYTIGDNPKPVVEYDEFDWASVNKSQSQCSIQDIAEAMYDALLESKPTMVGFDNWHIPFGDTFDDERLNALSEEKGIPKQMLKVMIATARCARVSYLNFEGKDDYHKDLILFEQLRKDGHWSPFEHCLKSSPTDCRNFKGFIPFRAFLDNQN